MFDLVRLDLSRQWFTPSLATVAELLVFYDVVSIRAPWGRLDTLLRVPVDDMRLFRRLVDEERIILELDQMPLGEVAWELGLFQSAIGIRSNPAKAEDSIRTAFTDAPMAGYNVHLNGGDETRQFYEDWRAVFSKVHNPGIQAGHARALIDRAIDRMNIVAEPGFVATALSAYGGAATDSVRKLLTDIRPAEFEIGGKSVRGFDAPAFGASAELLEFLSQADDLIDLMAGSTRDAFTSPSFERWTHAIANGSMRRVCLHEDIQAFTTSVLGRTGIADAIESGAKRFHEIEDLLTKREPFAKTIRERSDDNSLAEAYFEEIGEISWLTHGVGRAVRFSAFVGAGTVASLALTPLVGLAAAAGLSAIDYYVVDALVKGNRCRTFVETDIAQFLAG